MAPKAQIKPMNWLPRDRNVIKQFVKNFKEDSERSAEFKRLLDTITKYHPPVENENAAGKRMKQNFVSNNEIAALGLYPPVLDLYKLILTDPEVNMFFHQMFWQQNEDGEGIIIPSWQVFIVLLNFIMRYVKFRILIDFFTTFR